MGSRGNIVIEDENGERTWLYTQHGGREMTRALGRALVLFPEVDVDTIHGALRGYLGADVHKEDGRLLPDFDELHVDLPARTVSQVTLGVAVDEMIRLVPRVLQTWSFDEFVEVAESFELPERFFLVDVQEAVDAVAGAR